MPATRSLCCWFLLLSIVAAGEVIHAQSPRSTPFVPPTRENEKCVVLSAEEYKGLPADHFLKQETLTFDRYRAYRGTIEVVEYNALGSTSNPIFTMPRNVTEQDEVVLRLRGNTYAYNYVASYTASDLTQRELLNVIGASSTKGIFDTGASAGEATKTAAGAEASKPAPQGTVKQSSIPDDAVFRQLGLSREEYERTTNRIDEIRGELRNALTIVENGVTLQRALIDFESEVGELQLAFSRATARVAADPRAGDFQDLETSLTEAETAAARLPRFMASLRARTTPLFAQLDEEIPRLRDSLQRMQEALRAARARARPEDLAALDRADSNLQLPALLADVTELDAAKERMRNQVTALTVSVTSGLAALASARTDVARFQAAGRQTDICTSIGRFRNKTVKVTITATPVNPPSSAPAAAGAAAAATTASTATSGTAATPGAITREGTFEADAPTHVHVKLGPTVSDLDDPEFKLRTITDGCAEGRQCFVPYVSATNARQVRPAVHIALLVPGRYFWTGSDPGDPYETSSRADWLVPYPTFGFTLTDSTSNVMVGAGIDIGLGVGVQAGMHFGKVTRLLEEFRTDGNEDGLEGKPFDRPTGTTVAIADVTDKTWQRGFYVSLSLDASTLTRILNLGPGGR